MVYKKSKDKKKKALYRKYFKGAVKISETFTRKDGTIVHDIGIRKNGLEHRVLNSSTSIKKIKIDNKKNLLLSYEIIIDGKSIFMEDVPRPINDLKKKYQI